MAPQAIRHPGQSLYLPLPLLTKEGNEAQKEVVDIVNEYLPDRMRTHGFTQHNREEKRKWKGETCRVGLDLNGGAVLRVFD